MKNREKQENNSIKNKYFLISGADGGTAFSLAVFIPLLMSVIISFILAIAGKSQAEDFTSGNLFRYLTFLLPSVSLGICLLYVFLRRNLDFALTLGFKKCHYKYFILAIFILFGALFSLSWINIGFEKLIEVIKGEPLQPILLPDKTPLNFFFCLIIIGFLPAFFEECVFRGIILNGVRRLGDGFAIITVGLLFAIYHQSPAQTIYQFAMGAIFALLAIKSGSILPSMLLHFLNNAIILINYFFLPENFSFSLTANIVLGVLGGIMLVLSVIYLVKMCKIPDCDSELNEGYQKIVDVKRERKTFWLLSLAGVVGCVIMWFVALFS